MTNVYLKPATIVVEGATVLAIVRDPETLIPLAADGEWKALSPFWSRRLRDKDVIEAEPPAEAPPSKSSKAAAAAD